MSLNRALLISELEGLQSLDGRFQRIECVNYDVATDEKRGCFSLVFKAYDSVESRPVALKFFDVDPANLQAHYRLAAFEREIGILESLIGKNRCLQLAKGLMTYQLQVKGASNNVLAVIPCKYFAVEWIDDQIDHYFENQEAYEAEQKLLLFNDIVLGIEALHRNSIHHRDIKHDNLRCVGDGSGREVVAIDLGAAARIESPRIEPEYHHSAGAPLYSPPEAICGFAGDRGLGSHTDAFALGSLLFELFNPDYYGWIIRHVTSFDAVTAAIAVRLSSVAEGLRKKELDRALDSLGHVVRPLPVSGIGSTLPRSIKPQIDELCGRLTAFDYRKRLVDLPEVRRRIWSAIRALRNTRAAQIQSERRRRRREARADRLRRKDRRLEKFLSTRENLLC